MRATLQHACAGVLNSATGGSPLSRIFDALRRAELARSHGGEPGPSQPRPFQVLTVTSNKGGVGKTTLATNLAVYLRALREDLPILAFGLDDQPGIDRMFALEAPGGAPTVAEAIRLGTLQTAIRVGQYGVHYVPSSPETSELKREIEDPGRLRSVLSRTAWRGLVVIDTKSDLEILTQSALAASDSVLVVVKDHASLHEAGRVFEILEKLGRPRETARIVLSLVDLRVKFGGSDDADILALLLSEIRRRGWPVLESFVSRSPKVESLYTNPEGRARSILHGARDTLVHRQMSQLAQDVLTLLAGAPAH
jgi:cellulose biosynthesis protein BcsQ